MDNSDAFGTSDNWDWSSKARLLLIRYVLQRSTDYFGDGIRVIFFRTPILLSGNDHMAGKNREIGIPLSTTTLEFANPPPHPPKVGCAGVGLINLLAEVEPDYG